MGLGSSEAEAAAEAHLEEAAVAAHLEEAAAESHLVFERIVLKES
jgi:hypothetical protein